MKKRMDQASFACHTKGMESRVGTNNYLDFQHHMSWALLCVFSELRSDVIFQLVDIG